jgi:cytidylate kinase
MTGAEPSSAPTPKPGRRPIIAIAARLAARFGLLNLETGAMYRAFALKALESHVAVDDDAGLAALAATTAIRLQPSNSGGTSNLVFLDDAEVTGRIREPEVTAAASRVSVHPEIRRWMVAMQRMLGQAGGIVMEGRDIGTAVFPDADVKIFLDAAPEVRGLRRFEQIGQPGSEAAVAQEIRERDERDRTRAESPLKPAPDAILIDSSSLTFEQVLAAAEGIVTERLAAR